jgi:hypothetical protein
MGLPWASTKHESAAATTILRATKSEKATRIGIALPPATAIQLVAVDGTICGQLLVTTVHEAGAVVVVVLASVPIASQNAAVDSELRAAFSAAIVSSMHLSNWSDVIVQVVRLWLEQVLVPASVVTPASVVVPASAIVTRHASYAAWQVAAFPPAPYAVIMQIASIACCELTVVCDAV